MLCFSLLKQAQSKQLLYMLYTEINHNVSHSTFDLHRERQSLISLFPSATVYVIIYL